MQAHLTVSSWVGHRNRVSYRNITAILRVGKMQAHPTTVGDKQETGLLLSFLFSIVPCIVTWNDPYCFLE